MTNKTTNETLVWVVKRKVGNDENFLCDVKGTPIYWDTQQDAIDFLRLIHFSEEEIKKLIIKQVPIEECQGRCNIVEYEVRETNN